MVKDRFRRGVGRECVGGGVGTLERLEPRLNAKGTSVSQGGPGEENIRVVNNIGGFITGGGKKPLFSSNCFFPSPRIG